MAMIHKTISSRHQSDIKAVAENRISATDRQTRLWNVFLRLTDQKDFSDLLSCDRQRQKIK